MPPHPLQHANQFHDNRHTYIPEHAQRIMAQSMQRNLPASMKKYVGPYMQQNVMQPSVAAAGVGPRPTSQFKAPPRVMPSFAQPAAPPAPPEPQPAAQIQPQVQSQTPAPAAAAGPAPAQPYDFIMNPDQPSSRSLPLPRLDSTPKRAIFAVSGLFVLLIIFIIIKSVLSGGSSLPLYVGIAEDQQAIIHLVSSATTGTQTTSLNTANQNFAATANASISSSQTTIITYLANNKLKVKPKQLNLKVSQQLDTELTNAAAAGTYDSTFQQIMKDRLTTYMNDLSQVYNKSTGPKGRALLTSDYNQAKLLLTQLNSGQ